MAKAKKKQFQQRCIFCAGTPCSAEHYWPKWCHDLPVFEGLAGRIDPWSRTTHKDGPVIEKVRSSQRRAIYDSAFRVCEPCNNGWMSVLQNDAKFLLRGLVNGDRSTIPPAFQSKLVAWVTMTAMVMDSILDPGFTPLARRLFAKTRIPPQDLQIWIAPHAGETRLAERLTSSWIDTAPDGSDIARGGVVVFTLGRLAFFVAAGQIPSHAHLFLISELEGRGDWYRLLPPVLPLEENIFTQIELYPDRGLQDDGLDRAMELATHLPYADAEWRRGGLIITAGSLEGAQAALQQIYAGGASAASASAS